MIKKFEFVTNTQFLFQDLARPYDPKKSCWFPLKEGGFAEGVIEQAEGDKVGFAEGVIEQAE